MYSKREKQQAKVWTQDNNSLEKMKKSLRSHGKELKTQESELNSVLMLIKKKHPESKLQICNIRKSIQQ